MIIFFSNPAWCAFLFCFVWFSLNHELSAVSDQIRICAHLQLNSKPLLTLMILHKSSLITLGLCTETYKYQLFHLGRSWIFLRQWLIIDKTMHFKWSGFAVFIFRHSTLIWQKIVFDMCSLLKRQHIANVWMDQTFYVNSSWPEKEIVIW